MHANLEGILPLDLTSKSQSLRTFQVTLLHVDITLYDTWHFLSDASMHANLEGILLFVEYPLSASLVVHCPSFMPLANLVFWLGMPCPNQVTLDWMWNSQDTVPWPPCIPTQIEWPLVYLVSKTHPYTLSEQWFWVDNTELCLLVMMQSQCLVSRWLTHGAGRRGW